MEKEKSTGNVKINMKIGLILMLLVFSIFFFISNIFALSYTPIWLDYNQTYRVGFNISGATTDIDSATLIINLNQTFMGTNFNFSTHRDSLRVYYYNQTSTNYVLANHYAINWNNTNNSAVIQFKAPFLNSTINTPYYIYFGDMSKANIEDYCLTYIYCDYFNDSTLDPRLNTVDNDGAGGTSFVESSGVLAITAGGADTWTGSDQYGSVYLNDITGDVDIKVAMISQSNPNAWAKAGIMIKNDMTQSGSSTGYVFNTMTPGNGYSYQRDVDNNGYLEANNQGGAPSVTNSYLRVLKIGSVIDGYFSKTNPNSWTLIATSTITSALTTQDIGLSLTSHAGATLGNATFDNISIERYTTDSYTYSNSFSQELIEYLNSTITSPSIIVTKNVLQNNTLQINATIYCYSYRNQSCGNITSYIQYNSTSTNFANIATSNSNPMWSADANPQSCVLNFDQNCSLTWNINMTGAQNSMYKLKIFSTSNNSKIENISSEYLTTRIIIGSSVIFNQTNFDFGNITKNLGLNIHTIKLKADNGNNTNIIISCESGDCSKFSTNWIDGTNLNSLEEKEFNITCIDNIIGSYSAIFNATSNEFDGKTAINVSCQVNPLYGPLSIIQINPISSAINLRQNNTFSFKSNVSCLGICGKVTAFAKYHISDWFNESFNYRQKLNISVTSSTPSDYQILVYLNSTTIGSNFNWSNNCNDIRFVNSNTKLNYWLENCNTTSKEMYVWIKTNIALSSSSNYPIEMYYGNSNAISESSANNTFIQNSVFSLFGRCSGTGNCQFANHAQVDILRAYINSAGMGVDGSGYTTGIDDIDNPYGTDDNFYSRYRLLFIPQTTATFTFGTYTDDDSEVGFLPYDGYGYGINTTHTYGAHDVITTQYGSWHNNMACGLTPAIEGTRTLYSNKGYWIDFMQREGTGGEDQVMCLDSGSGYSTFNTANFPGQIFARNYVSIEPILNTISTEETLLISTNSSAKPLWTVTTQPQSCTMTENDSCIFEWFVNGTGNINTSNLVEIYAYSNYSQIESNKTNILNITIVDSQVPVINLTSPINNSKVIYSNEFNLNWYIDDDNANLTCKIYINNILNKTVNCYPYLNNSLNISLVAGKYNWSIEVNDSDLNFVNSTVEKFILMEGYDFSINKKIRNNNLNIYSIDLNLTNLNNLTRTIVPIDFVESRFNSGSFNIIYDFLNITIGAKFNGNILGWNLNFNESKEINYSITNNVADYYLLDEFIIGLD